MGRYLDRYLQGECVAVWDELLAEGEAIRQEPLFTDAQAVAHETMQRVRQNIETLILRLRSLGYQFGDFWSEKPHSDWLQPAASPEESVTFLPFVPPHPDVPRYLEQLETLVGPLPLSLRIFFLEVGGVNFLGTHPIWNPLIELQKLDPLYILPLTAKTLDLYRALHAEHQSYPAAQTTEPLKLILAPDSYHKFDISGAEPYRMAVPDARIDGPLLSERHHTTFVDYLRRCFLAGGLPIVGWEDDDFSRLPIYRWSKPYFDYMPLPEGADDLPLADYVREWGQGQKSKELTETLAFLRQDLLPI